MDFSSITLETLILDAAAVAALLVAWWTYKAAIKRHVQLEERQKNTMERYGERIARLEGKDEKILDQFTGLEKKVGEIGESVARIEGILSK